jgi:hypothetical protein
MPPDRSCVDGRVKAGCDERVLPRQGSQERILFCSAAETVVKETPCHDTGIPRRFTSMVDAVDNSVSTSPPRPVTDGERQILLDWVDATDDLAAFVSERRSDDPGIFRRIVVHRRATKQRLYLIHCPQNSNWWVVTSAVERENVGYFPTLRAALQFVRPLTQRG